MWSTHNNNNNDPQQQQQPLLVLPVSSPVVGTYGTATPPDPYHHRHTHPATTLPKLTLLQIAALLSTAFCYGCIFSTLFVITLPIECERIDDDDDARWRSHHHNNNVSSSSSNNKSIWLGGFVALAGLTQLISPLVGYLSDAYLPPRFVVPPPPPPSSSQPDHVVTLLSSSPYSTVPTSPTSPQYASVGPRLPYYILGAMVATTGLFGQMVTSYSAWWIHYSFAFMCSMMGLNVQYAMMLALIPDQISSAQIGIANGILAFLLVTGSIFGFTLFHVLLYQDSIQSMYGLYASIVILTSILTSLSAHERDAELSVQRLQRLQPSQYQEHFNDNTLPDQPNDIPTRNRDNNDDRPQHDNVKLESSSNRRRATLWRVRGAVQTAQLMVVTPISLILRSMMAPIQTLNWNTLIQCYTIDLHTNYNFFIVTLSRLFYYCGMSIQTFFLYYIHDVIQIPPDQNPETTVAILAMIGQCSGALTCYPVGWVSDRYLQGQRKPFIYVSCLILAAATFSLIYARTVHHMILICIILGAANGMYLTAETSLAVDTLTTDTHRTNQQQQQHQHCHDPTTKNEDDRHDHTYHDAGSAQLLGIWGVAAFVGSALGPLIGGPILESFGSTTTTTMASSSSSSSSMLHHNTTVTTISTAYSIAGYTVILLLSSVYFVGSAIILKYIKVDKKANIDC